MRNVPDFSRDRFTNPIGLAAACRQNGGGMGRWGNEIYDTICMIGADGQTFRLSTVADYMIKQWCPEWVTAGTMYSYIRAFMGYALAVPEDFSGPASRLERVRMGLYRLTDAGE